MLLPPKFGAKGKLVDVVLDLGGVLAPAIGLAVPGSVIPFVGRVFLARLVTPCVSTVCNSKAGQDRCCNERRHECFHRFSPSVASSRVSSRSEAHRHELDTDAR